MPAGEKSHAESSPRSRVTDTHGPYAVGDFHVCRVGGIVALHLGTPSGRFVFHVRELSFVRHARADRDANGHPFRSLAEIERARLLEERETEGDLEEGETERGRVGEKTALCGFEAGWEFLTQNLHLRVADVCAKFGFRYCQFVGWINREHPREIRELRHAARVPRPRLRPTDNGGQAL